MKCIVLYWNQKFTYRNTFATKTISQLTELRCCYILNFLGGVLVRGVVYMWRPERFCLDPATLCGKLCGTVCHTVWQAVCHTVSHCVAHTHCVASCVAHCGTLCVTLCGKVQAQQRERRKGCYHRSVSKPFCCKPATLVLLLAHLAVGCDTVMLLRGGRRRRRRFASSEPLIGWSCPPNRGSEEVPLRSQEVSPMDRWEPEKAALSCPTRPFPSSFSWCHRSSSPLADWPGGR